MEWSRSSNKPFNDRSEPRSKDNLVGQKAPFKLREIWVIRVALQLSERTHGSSPCSTSESTGIGRGLSSCARVMFARGDRIAARDSVMQQKTRRPEQFEITEPTREAATAGA
jgi:hypothetical protein